MAEIEIEGGGAIGGNSRPRTEIFGEGGGTPVNSRLRLEEPPLFTSFSKISENA